MKSRKDKLVEFTSALMLTFIVVLIIPLIAMSAVSVGDNISVTQQSDVGLVVAKRTIDAFFCEYRHGKG